MSARPGGPQIHLLWHRVTCRDAEKPEDNFPSVLLPRDYAPRSGTVSWLTFFCSKLKGPVLPAWRVSPFCRDRALHPTAGFSGEEAAVLGVLHRERAWPPEPSGKEPTARVGEEVAAGLEPCTQGKVSAQTQRLAVR